LFSYSICPDKKQSLLDYGASKDPVILPAIFRFSPSSDVGFVDKSLSL
jgi:hypothetical protein